MPDHTKLRAAPNRAYSERRARRLLFTIFTIALGITSPCFAQSPEVTEVSPPSWWIGSTANPIRLMIRGHSLNAAQVQVAGRDLRIIGSEKINERGTCLFVDLSILKGAQPGRKMLKVISPKGSTSLSFDVLPALMRAGRFQGFSPADVLYLIMIDRFSDGDQSNNEPPQSKGLHDRGNKFYYHGGDLQGIINHLPYLRDLGITAIWVTPWYDNYDGLNQIELKEGKPSTGFHGYNAQNFYAVEEHFGTLAKLQELINSAHQLGIKTIQDQVVNHTGPYHLSIDDLPTPTWFNGTKAHHLKNVFQTWALHDPRPIAELKRETMEGWFLDFLPDLNQNDPEVARYLIQNTLWWIGVTGLDGIRMDTWQYVPNTFWHQWTNALKREFPNVTVVGEVKDGDVVHTSWFQGGTVRDGANSGLDSLLDFPLFYSIRHAFAEGRNIDEIPKTLAKDYLYHDSDILVTLLGGHDDNRFMSEKGATIAGLKLANAFVLTTRGIPQLYYGDEIGMTGPDEPATRGDFPGGFPGDKRNAFSATGRTREEQELFEFIRKMVHLHARLEPLRRGKLINLYASERQYAYARTSGGEVVLMGFNNGAKSAEFAFDVSPLRLPNGTFLTDQLGVSGNLRIVGGKMALKLPERSVVMFVWQ